MFHFQSNFQPVTCILHHLAFLVWLKAHNFSGPITRFQTLKPYFLLGVLLLLDICFMVQKGFVYTISVDVYAFRLAFSGILPCILQHFALRLAPKCLAFSIKTHCIQRQNALHLAPYCTIFCCKQPINRCKWRFI